MRIYRMCATFGKLEHETLVLQPGLNIIEAPNEWGKSTWCAFLLAMFYGLDTRAKTTKTALADKERYAPWSGSPMSGRIDLCWNGRDITIERKTKGRVPLGIFRAYETETGLEIPELTAANCGELLLGVEQSVFRRAGFIRLADMPVTRDEALRRRLNNLVTTGDESGDAQRLEKQLREQKNRIRYNRTGLLPQAEEQRRQLEEKEAELQALQTQEKRTKQRLGEVKAWLRALENHEIALEYSAAEEDARKVAEAEEARNRAEETLTRLEHRCAALPAREEAERNLSQLRAIQTRWNDLAMEQGVQESLALPPEVPKPFREMRLEDMESELEADVERYHRLSKGGRWWLFALLGGLLLIGAVILGLYGQYLYMGICLALGLVLLGLGFHRRKIRRREAAALEEKYGSNQPGRWRMELEKYRFARQAYDREAERIRAEDRAMEVHFSELEKQRRALIGNLTPEKAREQWQNILACHDAREAALRDLTAAENHMTILRSMVRTARKPAMEDVLPHSPEDTARMILDTRQEQQRLVERLGQYRGRLEALGDPIQLEQELEVLRKRIARLEEHYAALELALETLAKAQQELQRRFAPRIASRAQELLRRMTHGCYDRLKLQEDLSVLVGAEREDVLHEALWRSDGTVDQLYLALRLAVAEELTAHAPLILDDALVRFDDRRLQTALEILKELSENKQVILFTCQHRETELLK